MIRFYRSLSITIEKSEDYVDHQPFYWLTDIQALIQVEPPHDDEDLDSLHHVMLKRKTEDFNPFDAVSMVNLSYYCNERRSRNLDTFLIVPDNEDYKRQLKSSEIVVEWMKLYLPQHVDKNLDHETVSSCFLHSRDFVPKIVGFTLLGVIALIIVFWFVGRRTLGSSPGGYNSM